MGGGHNEENFDMEAFGKTLSGQSAMKAFQTAMSFEGRENSDELLSYWKERGVKKELFDADAGDGSHRFAVHTPLDIHSGEILPLIYCSHRGGGSCLHAEFVGFSDLIEKERVIVVYPNAGGESNEDAQEEFPRIMKIVLETGYPIDKNRIYAVGFSAGSDATETLAVTYPDKIAAVAPCPGSNAMYNSLCRVSEEIYEKCIPLQMPVLFLGGTADFGDRYPFPDEECFENFNIWMEKIVKVADYKPMKKQASEELVKTTENPVHRVTGIPFPVTNIQHEEDRDWFVGEFRDESGRTVCRMILGDGVPHITTGCHARMVWDFLKHWLRDENNGGSIFTA